MNTKKPVKLEPSKLTLEKVETAKKYIQSKYSTLIKQAQSRNQEYKKILTEMQRLNISKDEQQDIRKALLKQESECLRKARKKYSLEDFQQLCLIGKGSFGQVKLCRVRDSTQELVAIKRLRKCDMINRNQIGHVNLQREILCSSQGAEYVVQLKGTFQDAEYLYFVLEYLPGGDFMTLLIARDTFSEQDSKFYMAQMVLAVEYIHSLGYIHRDIKPDNILIGVEGNIKLTDFGLIRHVLLSNKNSYMKAIQNDKMECFGTYVARNSSLTNLVQAKKKAAAHKVSTTYSIRVLSKVGTPQYIAPEVFTDQEYDEAIDWWSVGIIFYEMLFGYTPFSSDSPKTVCRKIMGWKQYLEYPDDIEVSFETADLLQRLLIDRSSRLSASEIKKHDYFKGFDWDKVKTMKKPFMPELSHPEDTRYFQKYIDSQPWIPSSSQNQHKDFNFAAFECQPIDFKAILSPLKQSAQRQLSQLRHQRGTVKASKHTTACTNNSRVLLTQGNEINFSPKISRNSVNNVGGNRVSGINRGNFSPSETKNKNKDKILNRDLRKTYNPFVSPSNKGGDSAVLKKSPSYLLNSSDQKNRYTVSGKDAMKPWDLNAKRELGGVTIQRWLSPTIHKKGKQKMCLERLKTYNS